MSCDGNRHRFLTFLHSQKGMDATHLEKLYQIAKARGPQSTEDEVVQAHKTRQLFLAMQKEGIKPPAHAANGLPKRSSRSGYAAIYNAIQKSFKTRTFHPRREDPNPLADLHESLKTLKDGQVYNMATGRNDNGDNRWGFNGKRYTPEGETYKHHIWFGSHWRWHSVGLPNGVVEAKQEARDILLGREEIPEEFLQTDAQGLLEDGYDPLGFDADHYNRCGHNIYGIHRDKKLSDDEYREIIQHNFDARYSQLVKRSRLKKPKRYDVDLDGFCADGFMPRYPDEKDDKDRFGYNRHGFKDGRSWTGYDEDGIDQKGEPRPKVTHYDAWGYHRKEGLTEPDKKGRRYNLIGWQYDP